MDSVKNHWPLSIFLTIWTFYFFRRNFVPICIFFRSNSKNQPEILIWCFQTKPIYLAIEKDHRMREFFSERSKLLQRQLSQLYTLRLSEEKDQQVLLSKSIHLSRFIKIASLDHIQNAPEIDGAKRVLSSFLPIQGLNDSKIGFRKLIGNDLIPSLGKN